MPYKIRVLIEVRNGDGNFLRLANMGGRMIPVENGKLMQAIEISAEEAILAIPQAVNDRPDFNRPHHD